MTVSRTGFAKGNLDAAIKMAVLALILGSLLSPLFVAPTGSRDRPHHRAGPGDSASDAGVVQQIC